MWRSVSICSIIHLVQPYGLVAGFLGLSSVSGRLSGVAVHGGGAGEDDGLAAVLAHDVDEGEGVADVVGVVLDGLGHRLAHGLEAGEVDHAVDVVLGEHVLERVAVVDVGNVHGEVGRGLGADDGFDAVFDLGRGVRQVVDDDNLVAALKQLDNGVGSQ